MMEDLFNNIYVFHKDKKISIVQHWDTPSSKLEYDNPSGNVAAMQEVGIMPDDGDWGNMRIERYGKSLTHLIKVLEGIRDEIDQEIHNESSGEGDARTAQSATGSAT